MDYLYFESAYPRNGFVTWDLANGCGTGRMLVGQAKRSMLAENVSAALLLTTRIFSFSDLLLADHTYTKGPPP